MGLFGSGQLRRQIQSLADEMETIRRELVATKGDNTTLKKQITNREEALKVTKESKKKLEKKLEKSNSARVAADKKANEHVSRLSELEGEVQAYRKQLIKARDEVDRLQGQAAQGQPVVESTPDSPAEVTPQDTPNKEFTPDPEREARRIDRRVERLEEKLEQEKAGRDELKDRLSRAEQTARADRRRISELNKAEAAVRDLQHSLRSERRAYKILQLQYEAQLERARAAEAKSTQAPGSITPETAEDDTPVTPSQKRLKPKSGTSTESAAAEPTETMLSRIPRRQVRRRRQTIQQRPRMRLRQ